MSECQRPVNEIAEDIGDGGGKAGGDGFDRLADERQLSVMGFDDWKKIDEAEMTRARDGAPREKFVAVADMIAAARGSS